MKIFTNIKNKFLSLPLVIKIIIPVIIIGLGWFITSKIISSKTSTPQYKTTQVQKGNIISTISASGSITSGNNTSIYTSASGVVTAIYVKNGDTVKQGQKIAEINLDQDGQQKQTSAWASYLSAKNSLTSAQQNKLSLQNSLDSAKITEASAQDAVNNIYNFPKSDLQINTINSNLTIAQRALDLAQQKYGSADSSIAVSQVQLSSAWYSYQQSSNIIYAPASGILSNFALTKGISVANLSSNTSTSSNSNATQSVGIITNPNNQVTASVSLTEIDVVNVKPGQKVTLTLDSFPDKTFTGQVLSINTNGQVSSGVTSYPTIIVLDSSLPNIYSNMSVSANIIIDSKTDVLTIPSVAIQTDSSGNSTVEVLKNNQVSQVQVATGISDSTNTEITSGLNVGDVVVTGIVTKTTTTTTKSATTSVFSSGLGGAAGGAARRFGQ